MRNGIGQWKWKCEVKCAMEAKILYESAMEFEVVDRALWASLGHGNF